MKLTLRFGKNETEIKNKFADESFGADLIGCLPITIFAIVIFVFVIFKNALENEQQAVIGAMSMTFCLFGTFILYRSLVNRYKFNKKQIEIIFDEAKLIDDDKTYKLAEKEIDFHKVVKKSLKYNVFEYINVGFYLNDRTLYYNFDLDSFFELKEFIDKYTNYKLVNIKE